VEAARLIIFMEVELDHHLEIADSSSAKVVESAKLHGQS
jgi:hypothetical protein